jgi:hypothetical protein
VRVEWAFACRALRRQGAAVDATGVGVDTFGLSVAAQVELVALMRVAAPEVDCGPAHPVLCRLTGPDLEPIESRDFNVTLRPPGPEHPDGWEVKAFVPVIFYLDTQSAGTYGLDVWIDGRFRWQVPFRLIGSPTG